MLGSGVLVTSLLPHGLVDELLLMVHPVVLGSGRRLLGSTGTAGEWRLVEASPTPSGVVVMTYRVADPRSSRARLRG